jgi:hypothetical protein
MDKWSREGGRRMIWRARVPTEWRESMELCAEPIRNLIRQTEVDDLGAEKYRMSRRRKLNNIKHCTGMRRTKACTADRMPGFTSLDAPIHIQWRERQT